MMKMYIHDVELANKMIDELNQELKLTKELLTTSIKQAHDYYIRLEAWRELWKSIAYFEGGEGKEFKLRELGEV